MGVGNREMEPLELAPTGPELAAVPDEAADEAEEEAAEATWRWWWGPLAWAKARAGKERTGST